ncbi:unnamed protein product [Gongylonema pulchrum]|uniref:Uncharacterized protein n=1 Tax=Gongylonema pulchrum TaxID=637853 RepID=A0A3P6S0S9_9BILA|nr:unnamed protein product [Gongylonema pulchrum]
MKPENAHLFYKEEVEELLKTAREKDDEVGITSETMTEEEKAARLRMFARAQRKNLRKKVERYLRSLKPSKKPETRDGLFSDEFGGLRNQLLIFKNALEEKIRETGLIQGAEVKVQLVSPFGSFTSGGGGLGDSEDMRLSAVLKAFLSEQTGVSDEENRYDRLARGYTYGADEEARERVRQNANDEDDWKSSILPIVKRVML